MASRVNNKATYLTATPTVLFTSTKKEIIFLEVWNDSINTVPVTIIKNVNNKIMDAETMAGNTVDKNDRRIVLNGTVLEEVDNETKDPHSFHRVKVDIGDTITGSAGTEYSIKYNIIK